MIDLGDAGKNLLCSVVLGSEFRGELGTLGQWTGTESFKLVCIVIVRKFGCMRSREVIITPSIGSTKF